MLMPTSSLISLHHPSSSSAHYISISLKDDLLSFPNSHPHSEHTKYASCHFQPMAVTSPRWIIASLYCYPLSPFSDGNHLWRYVPPEFRQPPIEFRLHQS